jgi:hypothetical protein
MITVGMYDRVGWMAVSAAQVTDPRLLTGTVVVDADPARWIPAQPRDGFLYAYTSTPEADLQPSGEITARMTRFIVDTGLDVNDLLDDAFTDVRALSDWTEHRADRTPITANTEGATFQSGCYTGVGGRCFIATTFVIYQRANVVHLLDCTGRIPEQARAERPALVSAVLSARFED